MAVNIVSLSGGKDSTALLLMMLERGMRVDRVICVDTTKEFPQMYAHLEWLQQNIDVEIETVRIGYDYWFGEHIKTKGVRKGDAGYGWPNFLNRWCTSLKQRAFMCIAAGEPYDPRRWAVFRADNIVEYHGIAADEARRATGDKRRPWRDIRYPLVEWGMTEADCLQYCYDHGYDWGGLYEKFQRLSCYCCPLSRLGELKVVHNEFPELWGKMRTMDKVSRRPFRRDYTLGELEQKFSCSAGARDGED